MKVADYIAGFLAGRGVTDVFGVPGGVILELIYAFDRSPGIAPHLLYHEQGAAFAASGYAQADGSLGVAYATRGPGIMNMLTVAADAYFESTALMLLTAHSFSEVGNHKIRTTIDQETDPRGAFAPYTKACYMLEHMDEVESVMEAACRTATSGRKGPVLIDINSRLLSEQMAQSGVGSGGNDPGTDGQNRYPPDDVGVYVRQIRETVCRHERPVLLVGDGISQSGIREEARELADSFRVPILSSRASQDIFGGCDLYYGYIGSHGLRHSNFILSKADCIISLGNRLSFPIESKTFSFMKKTRVLRFEIDEGEFERDICNAENYVADIKMLIPALAKVEYSAGDSWVDCCNELRRSLSDMDLSKPVCLIKGILDDMGREDIHIVSDVGYNDIWLSQAYAMANIRNRKIHTKSFKTAGSALPKAIGVYYKTRKPVVCFCGDQGFQMNSQELQFIGNSGIPVKIVLINNEESGMIRGSEKKYGDCFLHSTLDSGYSIPDFGLLSKAYGVPYQLYRDGCRIDFGVNAPLMVEIHFSRSVDLEPYIPAGVPCHDMYPQIERTLFRRLEDL